MGNGLDIPPPPRKTQKTTTNEAANDQATAKKQSKKKSPPTKFDKVAEGDKVQFNKRVKRATADGYEMLAITTRRKVPDLLDEALELLKEKHGKI